MNPIPDFENDPTLTPKQKRRRREYYHDRQANIAKTKQWVINNREKSRQWRREYRNKNRERLRPYFAAKSREWRVRHPEAVKQQHKTATCRSGIRRRRMRVKQEVISAYGGHCACCGETAIEFLGIDHINNNGAEHRRQLRMKGGGAAFYQWLKKNNFPKGDYQVLCHNCNSAKGYYGYCPHQKDVAKLLGIPCPVADVRRPRLTAKQKRLPLRVKIWRRKLDEKTEDKLVDMYLDKKGSMTSLAKQFGVSLNTVHRAVHSRIDPR